MDLQRMIKNKIARRKIYCSFLILMLSFNYVYATNYSTSIFADSIKVADSNSYKNSEYHFSIQPPPNWKLLNVPPGVSNDAIATFSDNSKGQLATFVIFHRLISDQVLEAINNHSNKEVLDELTSEMTSKTQDSRTNILRAGIERYSDGVRILTFSSTTYSSDNSTSYSANMIYYLNTGDQYTLVLTSNSKRFDQDLGLFSNSIDTFYASPGNTFSTQINIPAWVKNNAKWWADGTITDTDFIKSIQYMIDSGIIIVPHGQVGPPESRDIPAWVKNNAKWWADGTITDGEFVKGIEYLINNGILKI